MRLTPELRDKVINGTPAERRYICERVFMAFAMYYFPEYFSHRPAPYHQDFANDIESIGTPSLITSQNSPKSSLQNFSPQNSTEIGEVAWVGFKECAKTTYAKLTILWWICYRKKRYINLDSADGKNASTMAFETALELQTNKRLIRDFGQLFTESRSDDEKKMKKVTSFITANDIKVEAFSTGQSTRGRLFKNFRPDAYVLDDVENSTTITSVPMTQKIITHIDELRSGRADNCSILYLGNYITDTGVVQYIMDTVERSGGIVRFIPVIKDGKPTWGDKYVLTDAEAFELNKEIPDRRKWKISLEKKKRDLGATLFDTEMMLNPMSSGDLLFNRGKIMELMRQNEQENKSYEDSANFRMWDKFNPRHRYAIGADTAKGVGGDSSTSVLIDFTTNEQIGSFASNQITPDQFAHELAREGNMFGTCLLAPENNGQTGGTTLQELKAVYPIDMIHRPRRRKTSTSERDVIQDTLGWETTMSTKNEIIFALKAAVEDGVLKINDERILKELKFYARKELQAMTVSPLATRHFDLLIATAIAWAMRDYAELTSTVSKETDVIRNRQGRQVIRQDAGL